MRRGFSLVELLVVIAIIGVLFGLLLPAVQSSRESTRRTTCANHLRQMGLALQSYHGAVRHYPLGRQATRKWLGPSSFFTLPDHLVGVADPGDSFPPRLEQVGSWLLRIGPFLEAADGERMWGQPVTLAEVYQTHKDVSRLQIPTFRCPSDIQSALGVNPWGYAMSSYLAVSGNNEYVDADGHASNASNGIFPTQSWGWSARPTVTIAKVTAGLSKVTAVGERPPSADRYFGRWTMTDFDTVLANPNLEFSVVATDNHGLPCPSPGYFREDKSDNPCAATHFWSLHPGGGNWLMADSSVHFISYSAATTILPVMASVDGTMPDAAVYAAPK